jgi:hypothetical protein
MLMFYSVTILPKLKAAPWRKKKIPASKETGIVRKKKNGSHIGRIKQLIRVAGSGGYG